MNKLEHAQFHSLSAAIGWIELGNTAEARAELAHIDPAQQDHPDVLEVRWFLCVEEKKWNEGLEVARLLLKEAPERSSGWLHQAYALRRIKNGTVKKAWDALLPAFDKFPKESTISYNLSCYACQMQQLDAARTWFQRAIVIGEHDAIKKMALNDPDLEPLWEEIRRF